MRPFLLIWYLLVAVMMTSYLVTGGTRLGFGIWYLFAPFKEREYLLKALNPHVDGSSLWVLLTASSLFLFFPRIFRILFTGFYPVLAVVFIALGLRIAALTLRKRTNSIIIESLWDVFISLGNLTPLFLLGLIAGYILKGVSLFGEGRFNVNVLGYASHYTVVAGLLIACASAAMSYAAIAWNSDGKIRAYARKWTFYSSLITCVLIFDLALWSFLLSPYITESLKSNPLLFLVPGGTLIVSLFLPVLIWKRQYKYSYFVAVLVMIGLTATFFLTIYPHLRLIFARTNPISRDILSRRPDFSNIRSGILHKLVENRRKYLPVFLFLMSATAFLQVRMFLLHHKRTHCPLPYDGEDDELL